MKGTIFYSCPYMQRHLSRLQPRRPQGSHGLNTESVSVSRRRTG